MARSFKVLSPTAILGYGFPEESFRKAMAESPDLIAVDAGSSDPGPHYLGQANRLPIAQGSSAICAI
ncbi:hypothetical protein VEE46_30000 [Escherichia coli]|nr:hypothetical protein VEE46_30000 [Escherichia coli]